MWNNNVYLRYFKDAFHWKVFLTSSIALKNKWWGIRAWQKKKYHQLTVIMHIQTARIDCKSLFMGENAHISLTFINSKTLFMAKEWRWVFCILSNVIKLNWKQNEFRVFICWVFFLFFFQKWCPGFKSPSLKWAHHKTNTVWQQAGSLCSYEAQNLMSMNNEYYSTCWWLSRLPVIRSMKALFSREHSLSRWMMDSHDPADTTHWK